VRWEEINFDQQHWRIPESKNGEVLTIPLIEEAIIILQNRLKNKKDNNLWVFPGNGKTRHLVEPKSAWKRILKRAGIQNLRIHDIRRTLGSYQTLYTAIIPLKWT
jgi:integrase